MTGQEEVTPEDYFARTIYANGILYYPGAGRDYGPLRLFAEHGHFSTVIHADWCVDQQEANRFVRSIPNWRLVDEPMPLSPEDFGVDDWRRCWARELLQPLLDWNDGDADTFSDEDWEYIHEHRDGLTVVDAETYPSPEIASAFKANLVSPEGLSLEFIFMATEAVQTYFVMAEAGYAPTAVVLQDHGNGWAGRPMFGGEGELYERAPKAGALPQMLFVAKNTVPWPDYERVTDWRVYEGQMHNHPRAIFVRRDGGGADLRRPEGPGL